MRILQRLLILSLLPLAACDGGTLPATDPIHGSWYMPIELFLGRGDIDRAEHRYAFHPDGTYLSSILGWDRGRVVYESQMTGEYRLEAGGLVTSAQTYRWRSAESLRWQDEVVGDRGIFGPPAPYTVDNRRLIIHRGPSRGEHDEPLPARDEVYTRRR
ncbi:MAG TPA: hypothetical protein VFY65_17805 [Longimicrobium sp.]|nr:hypothetical protein [Longimicrobium sp.]